MFFVIVELVDFVFNPNSNPSPPSSDM